MKVSRLPLTGCLEIVPPSFKDERGSFTKSFLAPALEPWGIDFDFREEFYSWSQPGVLRGMHFQVPPAAHGKFVQVLAGEILDVLLDLRTASPTFGRALSLPLSAAEPKVLYLPAGIAHGFKVVGNAPALVHYKTDHE
jgi:dTDP-4-dehydrorhamnose 3,5-epimerase